MIKSFRSSTNNISYLTKCACEATLSSKLIKYTICNNFIQLVSGVENNRVINGAGSKISYCYPFEESDALGSVEPGILFQDHMAPQFPENTNDTNYWAPHIYEQLNVYCPSRESHHTITDWMQSSSTFLEH